MGAKVEINLTKTLAWQNKYANQIKKHVGFELSITPLYLYAIAKCMTEMPESNCRIEGSKIITHDSVDIGILSTLGEYGQDGGMIIIRNASEKNVEDLLSDINNTHKSLNKTFNYEKKLPPELLQRLQKISKIMNQPTVIVNTLSLYGVEIDHPYLPEGIGVVLTFGTIRNSLKERNGNILSSKVTNLYGVYNPLMASGVNAMRFMGRLRQIIENAEYQTSVAVNSEVL